VFGGELNTCHVVKKEKKECPISIFVGGGVMFWGGYSPSYKLSFYLIKCGKGNRRRMRIDKKEKSHPLSEGRRNERKRLSEARTQWLASDCAHEGGKTLQ